MKKSIHQLQIPILLALTCLTADLSPAATIIWSGASGTDTNWSNSANWIGGLAPGGADDVKFYDDGADVTVSNVNNIVNSAFGGSVLSLQYGNTNSFHTTLIESGKTLTVLGNLSVATDTDNGSAQSVFATITGPGARLVVSNTAANLIVRQGSANSGGSLRATLDLSGVDTFSATIGRMLIGSETANPAGGPRPAGTLFLARTNTIVASGAAPAIAIGGIGGNNNNGGNSSFINLGYTNAIFADSIRVGRGKQGGNSSIIFNPAFISENPAAYFRGANQVGRVSAWNIADSEGIGGTVNTRGFDDFTGGNVDALVDTMLVGRSSTGTGAGSPAGTLTFALGTIDVNNLQVGIQGASGANNATGTVNVNGTAVLLVNTTLELGRTLGGTGTASGTLNVNGGTVRANNIITSVGSPTSAINVTSGALVVTNTAGTPAAPLSGVSLSDSTLRLGTITPTATNVVVTNLTTGGSGNVINIGLLGGIAGYPAQIRLIQYQSLLGSGYNFTMTGLPGAYSGFLSNNTAFSSIDLVLTSGPVPQAIVWRGTPSGDWDFSTANWRAGATSTNYNDGDFPTFDDTASGTTTIKLTAALLPGSIAVNNSSLPYTFTGSGGIGGLGGLTKQGSSSLLINNSGGNSFGGPMSFSGGTVEVGNGGTSGNLGAGTLDNNAALIFNRSDDLTVANLISGSAAGTITKNGGGVLTMSGANTFTGAVTVAQGTLKPANASALGRTNGATTVTSGATLDVNGLNLGAELVTVSGAGVGGNGAIINSGAGQNNALRYVRLGNNTTVGGTGRWDIRAPTTSDPSGASLLTGSQPYSLIKTGANQISLVGVTVDPALGDVDVQAGLFSVEVATTGLGNPASALTVRAGATLQFFNMTNLLNKVITLNGTGTNNTVNNGSGANTVIGPMTLNGNCIFNAGGTSLTLSNTIAGTGNLIKSGANTLILAGGPDSYSGNTTLSNGTLLINATVNGGGTLTTLTNTTLGGTGNHTGPVVVGGTLSPGTSAGTLTTGPLSLSSGATLAFELNSVNTIGSGVNDLLQVNGNLTANNNSITLGLPGGSLQAATYRLINYTPGGLTGSFNPTVTVAGGATRYGLALDTTTAGQVNLAVSGSTANLRWNSTSSGTWDIGTTANWFNLGSSVSDVFYQADSVSFDDTPGGVPPIDIPSGVTVAPSAITNNSTANNYTIAGAGRIIGGAVLVKDGASTLTLGTTNNALGGLIVRGGTVRLAAAATAGTGLINVNNSGTLVVGAAHTNSITLGSATLGVDAADFVMSTASELTIAASTLNTIQSSDPQNPGTSRNIQVDGTLRGSGNILVKNADNITSPDANQGVRFRGTGATDYSGTITVANNSKSEMRTSVAGPFSPVGTGKFILTCGAYDGGNTLTCPATGGYLEFNLRNNTAGDTILGNNIEITGSGAVMFNPLSDTPAPSNSVVTLGNLKIGGGQELIIYKGSGNPYTVKFQSVTLTGGNVTFTPRSPTFGAVGQTGSDLSLGSITEQAASSITVAGLRTLILTGANGFTGDTIINSGTLALTGSSSLANSPNITIAAGAVLDVSGRTDGKLTLNSGRTLSGNGTILGSLAVNAGATVSPGASAGTLTVTNVAALAGNAVMEIDKVNATNDVIRGAASIQYGGTLTVSEISATPFADGDTFKLFDATGYSGAFSSITPAMPGSGLFWDASQLTTSGTLKVAATAPPPSITGFAKSGTNIVFSGSGGASNGLYYVLASTNVALPLTNWTRLTTNVFDSNGAFGFTNGIDAPRRFYLLQLP